MVGFARAGRHSTVRASVASAMVVMDRLLGSAWERSGIRSTYAGAFRFRGAGGQTQRFFMGEDSVVLVVEQFFILGDDEPLRAILAAVDVFDRSVFAIAGRVALICS
jgi:hypothetical protein